MNASSVDSVVAVLHEATARGIHGEQHKKIALEYATGLIKTPSTDYNTMQAEAARRARALMDRISAGEAPIPVPVYQEQSYNTRAA